MVSVMTTGTAIQRNPHVEVGFSPTIALISVVRAFVSDFYARVLSSDVREMVSMATHELLENAVKYGDAVRAAPQIHFAMSANSKLIEITVVNGSTKSEQIEELERHVHEITGAQDRAAAYFGRLRELASHPDQSGKLGIYRIVFEGEFDLDVAFADQVVTVRAKRVVE